MSFFYQFEHIELKDSIQTGHTVFPNASYNDPTVDLSQSIDPKKKKTEKIVYKANKHNNARFSHLEVAFTDLLKSGFLAPNLTPAQFLVKNSEGVIVGLASEHCCYMAARREGLGTFYALNVEHERKDPRITVTTIPAKASEDIPIYFLNQFRPGYFEVLWKAHKEKKLFFDMSSLASVLTSSYTLEEDDLHKGNLGFYLVKRNGRTTVVFFKIDNDLMMSDSVMSHYSSRVVNWRHGENAYDISQRDLIGFPKLLDSKNHYWPTSKRYIANPIDDKVYSSAAEIQAFIELGVDEEFKLAKWREFYRQILIPASVIEPSLINAFEKEDASDRAQRALLVNAAIARQARLRAVLFSIPEFRAYVRGLDYSARESIRAEILDELTKKEKEALSFELSNAMVHYQLLCNPSYEGAFDAGDTPLHVAIRLKDYRYQETWQAFSKFAEQTNSKGEKPLDLAVSMARKEKTYAHNITDIRQNPFLIVKSLLKEGVVRTTSYNNLDEHKKLAIKNCEFGSDYLEQTHQVQNGTGLIVLLRDIGEDYHYSLKMKKELTIAVMRNFIAMQRENPELNAILTELKGALNGNEEKSPVPELQFIRQLRSSLWIVRIMRGLLGGTATQVALNELIDNELKRATPNNSSSHFSFFSHKKEDKREEIALECSNEISVRSKSGLL